MPLVETRTSPAAVALVGLVAGRLPLPNMWPPTGFLVPLVPWLLT
jgi:hypothetical protein